MANYSALYSVGNSLAQYLQSVYPADLTANFACQFQVVSSTQIANEETTELDKTVSIFLHRVTVNENFRAASILQDSPNKQPVIFLDLHYLLTYWGTSAQAEQTILGWTLQQLQSSPVLDSSVLTSDAGWDPTETVQLVLADLSLEDILRIWDALGPKYRLSIAYVARVVRIDRATTPPAPVVATQFTFGQKGLSA
jgi:hypothetical protein